MRNCQLATGGKYNTGVSSTRKNAKLVVTRRFVVAASSRDDSENEGNDQRTVEFDMIENNLELEHPLDGKIFVFEVSNIPFLEKAVENHVYKVGLMDPEEISHHYYHADLAPLVNCNSISNCIQELETPELLMRTISEWQGFKDQENINSLCRELMSSVEHQEHVYENRPRDPDLETWKAIDWETSIVEGHATHPMHRTRFTIPPLEKLDVSANIYEAEVVFVSIKRENVIISGSYEELTAPLLRAAKFDPKYLYLTEKKLDTKASRVGEAYDKEMTELVDLTDRVILPVHKLQIPAVKLKFGNEVEFLPYSVSARGQASVRTLALESLYQVGRCIKLPIAIKITSALRTVTPWSTFIGPNIDRLVPVLKQLNVKFLQEIGSEHRNVLKIASEPASIVYKSDDFDLAKHLACIVRDDMEYIVNKENAGKTGGCEKVIVCAALTEKNSKGIPNVIDSFGLYTKESRVRFLYQYSDIFFACFVPPMIKYGWSYEAHQQNVAVVVSISDNSDKEINGMNKFNESGNKGIASKNVNVTGFVARDFGGIKVHLPTLRKVLHENRDMINSDDERYYDLEMLPDSCTEAYTMNEVYKLGYHTMIQCQMYRLVRALDLHYCGTGWSIVRKNLEKYAVLPEAGGNKPHQLLDNWYSQRVNLKCFIKMKLDSLYRDYIYESVPNVLLM
ncbi:hypothetical protein AX774_g4656 [Zancudomyces culisetae]|uniref:Aerobactin siderophore biosynthesis IucA/IucC N-terminal domain-containing protein n=1 Tax=Zancudomyces culisetae TaxID=1213189 RepID=A0A1R1PLY2_ZANCU|nr:hypothetical protein AX774_g4656 [Zancudomyces culisetae]|eukprot:OMH81882.1 hypothetical protein AX774_g4656 [Zancudomyces culisetae]